jgi:ATP-dependent helicase Lhr and Lhr-like helicase
MYERVVVFLAFGVAVRVPFWKGDGLGRPAELGAAIGAFSKTLGADSTGRLTKAGLDERAANNLIAFVEEQKAATGYVPSDTTLVVERFRDELGDWRVILHSPFGMPVHAPWALAVGARIRERLGVDGAAMASDDGIVVRIPDTDAEAPGASLFLFDDDELQQLVTSEVGGSALFASRFRECAARALLLPRRDPGKRQPLWQQRQRSAQLLEVAAKYPTFPIVLETVREVLQDVYDLPSLTRITREIASRSIRVVETQTETPSPFARSMLFGYVASFMYEGDSPLAERRAAALSLDPTLLSELLGRTELRELLDPDVIDQMELELQRLVPERKAKDAEGVVDLLRVLGPQSHVEIVARSTHEIDLDDLRRSFRLITVTIAGETHWGIVEDAGRLRDALGTPVPIGVPGAFLDPVADPIGDLVARYARTHGPFTTQDVADRFGLGIAVVQTALKRLASDRRILEGEFRPGATGSEWCDAEVLRRIRSRSLAALRHEVEPVDAATFGRFLPAWQHVGTAQLRGVDGVAQVVDQLAGVALPASALETLILPARVRDYSPGMLDELMLSGEVLWAGDGDLPGHDGWVSLHLASTASLTLPLRDDAQHDALEQEILVALAGGGAFFFRQLSDAVGSLNDKALQTALWNLVWAGLVTNDTLAPLRAHLGGPARPSRVRSFRGRPTMPKAVGAPNVGGRWSLLPLPQQSPTVRAKALAEQLLERHGVVTRGAVASEDVRGGFALAYKVLSTFEQNGRARRGYFIEGLGAAQFATGPTIDRLRSFSVDGVSHRESTVVVLAATDPANPFGAALPWPSVEGHKPGRKAGALVGIVDGELALFVEKGGKSVLTLGSSDETLGLVAAELARVVRTGIGKLRVEKVDGEYVIGTPFGTALEAAGFTATPQGLRLRA